VFVSDHEIQGLVEFWRAQVGASPYTMPGGAVDAPVASGVPLKQVPMFEDMSPASDEDPLLKDSINIIRKEGKASVSMLQRKLRIGYTRASRLMDTLEEKGIVAPPDGMSQVRRVIETEDKKETQAYQSESHHEEK
jgi:S-DNA-T family DNA segregation ATPase FtsK/SpoIIIE